MKSWMFDFGPVDRTGSQYIKVTADMKYCEERGYGFLGLGPDGHNEDPRSDGFVLQEGQEIKLRDVSKLHPASIHDDAVAVTEPGMPIRFAVRVRPNTHYKVKVTLVGADPSKDAVVNLFSEKRHMHLTEKVIPAGTILPYEFNVNVQNVYSKVTGIYEDTMLNIAVCGDNAAISSAEIQQLEHGRTIWVLGDSTVTDQLAPLPYFRLQNYAGVGQALPKYIGPDIAVSNHAESGLNAYSSKPHFDQFKDRIRSGDFVYFQFGHNHKKDGPEGYYDGISYYYDYVRQRGAKFIIVGPIDRHRDFQYDAAANVWSSTLAGFSEKGRQYAEEKIAQGAADIAFVDLNASSLAWYAELCEALGKTHASTDYYFRAMQREGVDGTHPNDAGVDHFAKMFIDGAKAVMEADPESPQANILAEMLEGARDEIPYIVPASIIDLGPAPNAAYPEKLIQPKADYPFEIRDVVIDGEGHILSMSAIKQDEVSIYGRGIVEVYKPNGEWKGTAYADEQFDHTIEGKQTVSFSADLIVGPHETWRAYIMGFEDRPGYPLTDQQLSDFYTAGREKD